MKQEILAIDDEPHMLRLLERIITEKTNYGITTTHNSLEVPEILANRTFDVIISDLKMPGLDGLDILKYIRDNNRDEVVLIITAFGSLDSALEALSRGAFDYITKPFKKEQIIYTIGRAMDLQLCRREAARLGRLFEIEPFEKAQQAFQAEYVERLSHLVGRDAQKIAERSGLSVETVSALLQE